ncbi:hypothetical protein ACVWWO_003074 [Bradyrhizobium sp. F1.13.1]
MAATPNPGLKHDPDQIEADFGTELGRRMIDFSYGTTNFTHDLIRRYQIPCEARQNGTLRAAYNQASAAAIETTARQCTARGMPVSYLNREQLRAMTGTDRYVGAMLDTRGGDLHPLSYARGLARAAISAGAKVHGETPALSLRREGSRWRIETPRAVVHADKVLLATNGFTERSLAGASPNHRAGVLLDRGHRAVVRRRGPFDHADPSRPLRERPHHRLLPHRSAEPPLDGGARSDALDQFAARRRLSHAIRRAAMAAAQGRCLDPWLEQPARDHWGSLPACARARGQHPDLARLQRPRRRALDRNGRAAGPTSDRRRQGRARHARHRHQADPDARILARWA